MDNGAFGIFVFGLAVFALTLAAAFLIAIAGDDPEKPT